MNENRHRSGIGLGVLLPMGLTCLFALCSLALALMGGRAYKQIQANIDDSYGSTVAGSYLRTKLQQNNTAGAILLREEGEHALLVIKSRAEERAYEIRIYMHEGELRENFVSVDTPFDPAGGMAIAWVHGCEFSIAEDGLFEAEIQSPAGARTRVVFALAKGGGA